MSDTPHNVVPITEEEPPRSRPAKKQPEQMQGHMKREPDPFNDPTRSMPWDSDAEKGVLSCFLHENNLLDDAIVNIPDSAMYHSAHQGLYKVMQDLWEMRRPIEYIALTNYLRDEKLLEKYGGAGFLSELLNFVPTPAHYPYYKGILTDKHRLRKIIRSCTETVQRCYEGGLTDEAAIRKLVDDAQQGLDGVFNQDTTDFLPIGVMAAARREDYKDMMATGRKLGISTGFPEMDRLTGGYRKKHVWVLAGGTSEGKSAMALNMAVALAEQSVPVAYYLFEMDNEEKTDRLFGMLGRISSDVFNEGITHEYQDLVDSAYNLMENMPLYLRDMQGDTLSKLMADIRLGVRKKGWQVVFIDYLQLVDPDTAETTREREVAKASKRLKALAKQLGITIVILSQTNDDGKLRESRAIGQDADKVAFMEVPHEGVGRNYKKFDHRRNLIFDKNRGGRKGRRIQYDFIGEHYRFRELGTVEDAKTLLSAS